MRKHNFIFIFALRFFYARWNHHKSFGLRAPLTFWVPDIIQVSNQNIIMKCEPSDQNFCLQMIQFHSFLKLKWLGTFLNTLQYFKYPTKPKIRFWKSTQNICDFLCSFRCSILSHVMFQEDNKITEELLCPFFVSPHLMLAIYVRFVLLNFAKILFSELLEEVFCLSTFKWLFDF